MGARSVQVSIDEELLRRVDRTPEARRDGRSKLIASALRLYLEARRRHDIDDKIRRAYGGHDKALAREVEQLMGRQARPRAR
ncbi:MAG: ribbon-helix-helix protein, CopG family [Myxococcaceae bacterium]|nr:ribbon-helix-helix protein, CopG family [Myxococcaceae bacterium]